MGRFGSGNGDDNVEVSSQFSGGWNDDLKAAVRFEQSTFYAMMAVLTEFHFSCKLRMGNRLLTRANKY